MTPTIAHYLVGAALLADDARTVLLDVVATELNDPDLASIVSAVQRLTEQGDPADVPSVAQLLARDGSALTVADVQAVADVCDRFGSPGLASHYRDILREQNRSGDRQRFFAALLARIQTDPEYDYAAEIDAFTRVEQVRDAGGHTRLLDTVLDGLLDDLARREAGEMPAGVLTTGLRSLDRMLHGGGLHPGELVILGGRPGSSKTAVAGQIAMNVARRDEPVLFISAEVTAESLARRMVLEHTGLPGPIWDHVGALDDRWAPRRREAAHRIVTEMRRLPIRIHDATRPTVASMRQVARRHGPIRLLIFDYTSLAGDTVRSDSEERRMAEIALNLQEMARDIGAPVIALHQLSRAVEVTSPYRPAMAHLRDSGQVEANAHLVWLLYRRQYYVDQDRLDPKDGTEYDLEINVAKNRDGKTGIVKLRFDGATMRVREPGEDR